jgi:hypothetical protein
VTSATFSPDGTRIVTASEDRTARVWDSVPYRERFPAIQRARAAAVKMAPVVRERLKAGASPEDLRAALATDASLSPEERTAALAELLRRLKSEGVSVLLVEHDMDFVMGLADRVTVMEFGQKIAEGEKVIMYYGAANRDAAVFADPDRLDVTRANADKHIAFGYGPHTCIGKRVAQIQLEEAYRQILARFPDMRWTGEIDIAPNNFVHAIRKLDVSFTPERTAA